MKTFKATINDQGRTLFRYLTKMFPDVPLSRLEKLFRKKDIKINGKRINDKKYKISEHDEIVVYGIYSQDKSSQVVKANIQFKVIYEDKNIVLVEKKSGVQIHDYDNSLDQQVLAYLKYKPTDSFKPSHIGRLDKVTSGIMVYGKTYDAVRQINDASSKLKKIYQFRSDLKAPITTTFNIAHDEENMREVCGDEGKTTKTIFFFEDGKKYAELKTGRKHQIRASLSKLGFPIYGDVKYGGKRERRVYLHATLLRFDGLSGDLEYLNKQEFRSRPEW